MYCCDECSAMCVTQVFDLAASCSLLCCVNITMEYGPIHKDRSILVSHNSIKDYVLFAYRSECISAIASPISVVFWNQSNICTTSA